MTGAALASLSGAAQLQSRRLLSAVDGSFHRGSHLPLYPASRRGLPSCIAPMCLRNRLFQQFNRTPYRSRAQVHEASSRPDVLVPSPFPHQHRPTAMPHLAGPNAGVPRQEYHHVGRLVHLPCRHDADRCLAGRSATDRGNETPCTRFVKLRNVVSARRGLASVVRRAKAPCRARDRRPTNPPSEPSTLWRRCFFFRRDHLPIGQRIRNGRCKCDRTFRSGAGCELGAQRGCRSWAQSSVARFSGASSSSGLGKSDDRVYRRR